MNNRILTVPEEIKEYSNNFITGNEYLSLPIINPDDAGIYRVGVIYGPGKSLLEFSGDDEPLLSPYFKIKNKEISSNKFTANYKYYWMPEFKAQVNNCQVNINIFAPPLVKGFVYQILLKNGKYKNRFMVGIKGKWKSTLQTIFHTHKVITLQRIFHSPWTDAIVLEARPSLNLVSLAILASQNLKVIETKEGESPEYKLGIDIELIPFEVKSVAFYVAVQVDSDGAATTAVDMRRQGFEHLQKATTRWLKQHIKKVASPKIERRLNQNLFFNYFYTQALTIDNEELILLTSRSPLYYVGCAFWARDALLWSFPAVLLIDKQQARKVLRQAFRVQLKNPGEHSCYIDGVQLYPGFELDQLCAYLIALGDYVEKSGDKEILFDDIIKWGVEKIENIMFTKKHPKHFLFSTYLLPTDDPAPYPYHTYNNVLVWKSFLILSKLHHLLSNSKTSKIYKDYAKKIKDAIWKNCVVRNEQGEVFAWCIDLEGNYCLGDEPPGSLVLLPYYGFCGTSCLIYKNTLKWIYSPKNPYYFREGKFKEIGCIHAPHPWPLAAANRLLSGDKKALKFLLEMEMDNNFACESIDENTGKVKTGPAFATGAGFIAYSIYQSITSF